MQEFPGTVAKKVDMFEIELRMLRLHEHWYEDRNKFGQKVADLGEKVDYWKQVLAGLDILLKTYGTPERIYIKSVKEVEEAFHTQMCETAEEQCGEGNDAAGGGGVGFQEGFGRGHYCRVLLQCV